MLLRKQKSKPIEFSELTTASFSGVCGYAIEECVTKLQKKFAADRDTGITFHLAGGKQAFNVTRRVGKSSTLNAYGWITPLDTQSLVNIKFTLVDAAEWIFYGIYVALFLFIAVALLFTAKNSLPISLIFVALALIGFPGLLFVKRSAAKDVWKEITRTLDLM